MARQKRKIGCLGTLIMIPFLPISMFIDYATHYKPTPIIGSKRGRKKKEMVLKRQLGGFFRPIIMQNFLDF